MITVNIMQFSTIKDNTDGMEANLTLRPLLPSQGQVQGLICNYMHCVSGTHGLHLLFTSTFYNGRHAFIKSLLIRRGNEFEPKEPANRNALSSIVQASLYFLADHNASNATRN